MPEILERPVSLPFLRAIAEPYRNPESSLIGLSRQQLAFVARHGRETAIHKYPHLAKQVNGAYELLYGLLLLPDSARMHGNRNEHRKAAKAQHALAHYMWHAQQENAPDGYVNAMFKLVKTTETLLFDPRSVLRSETSTPQHFWAAARAEAVVIREITGLGLGVVLPNYEQKFNPNREWKHEVTQMDLESGIDFIAIEQGKARPKAIGIDVKSRAGIVGQRLPIIDKISESRPLNPLVAGILNKNGVAYFERVVITIPAAAYEPFSHLANPKDIGQIREFVRSWGKLRPEAKYDFLEKLNEIVEN